jgi:hypothetical protein
MILTLLFLIFFPASPAPGQISSNPTEPPSLIVQIVDPVWSPIPGAEVTVRPLSGKAKLSSNYTDAEGYAKFFVPGDTDYSVEASLHGFKNARLKRIHLSKRSDPSPTSYVQFKMDLSGSRTIMVQ